MVGLPLSPPRLMMVNGNSVSAQQTICVISCLRGSFLKTTTALENGDLIVSPLCPAGGRYLTARWRIRISWQSGFVKMCLSQYVVWGRYGIRNTAKSASDAFMRNVLVSLYGGLQKTFSLTHDWLWISSVKRGNSVSCSVAAPSSVKPSSRCKFLNNKNGVLQ